MQQHQRREKKEIVASFIIFSRHCTAHILSRPARNAVARDNFNFMFHPASHAQLMINLQHAAFTDFSSDLVQFLWKKLIFVNVNDYDK